MCISYDGNHYTTGTSFFPSARYISLYSSFFFFFVYFFYYNIVVTLMYIIFITLFNVFDKHRKKYAKSDFVKFICLELFVGTGCFCF